MKSPGNAKTVTNFGIGQNLYTTTSEGPWTPEGELIYAKHGKRIKGQQPRSPHAAVITAKKGIEVSGPRGSLKVKVLKVYANLSQGNFCGYAIEFANPVDLSQFNALRFWVKSKGTPGSLPNAFVVETISQSGVMRTGRLYTRGIAVVSNVTGKWQEVTIPFSELLPVPESAQDIIKLNLVFDKQRLPGERAWFYVTDIEAVRLPRPATPEDRALADYRAGRLHDARVDKETKKLVEEWKEGVPPVDAARGIEKFIYVQHGANFTTVADPNNKVVVKYVYNQFANGDPANEYGFISGEGLQWHVIKFLEAIEAFGDTAFGYRVCVTNEIYQELCQQDKELFERYLRTGILEVVNERLNISVQDFPEDYPVPSRYWKNGVPKIQQDVTLSVFIIQPYIRFLSEELKAVSENVKIKELEREFNVEQEALWAKGLYIANLGFGDFGITNDRKIKVVDTANYRPVSPLDGWPETNDPQYVRKYDEDLSGVLLHTFENVWRTNGHSNIEEKQREVLRFETWIKAESSKATTALLANISPAGAARGAVIASPSTSNPDYSYHWVRDAGLTMAAVNTLLKLTKSRAHLARMLDFVDFSRRNQLTPNRSGGPDAGGLGEPKFYANGLAFDGDWGRPQTDSPAVRAIALIRFAEYLLRHGPADLVREKIYDGHSPTSTALKADLEYVSHNWRNSSTFDLWEEVRGRHFYTRLVQRRALKDGAALAAQLQDGGAAAWYCGEAEKIEAELEEHWDPKEGYLRVTLDQKGMDYKKSGLDSSVILAVLHAASDDDPWFGPTDDRVLATAKRLSSEFGRIYKVNHCVTQGLDGAPLSPAIGRYPEDRYTGYDSPGQGNPWVLATAGLAELYYRCATTWQAQGVIRATPTNLPFLCGLPQTLGRGQLQEGDICANDPRFKTIIRRLRETGDGFLRRIRYHAWPDGALSEQINRDTGYMQGAPDLTWSYAAVLTAIWARD